MPRGYENMVDKIIPQFIPYWGEDEANAVADVLASDYLNEHKTVREFEKKFAEFVGAKYCSAVTSGTMALYIALMVTRPNYQSGIRLPDFDGIFGHNAVIQANLMPVLCDVEKNGSLQLRDNEAGLVVHANGRLGKPTLVEDCAQAIDYHTNGLISTYSFASTKHLTMSGQGGAICCDDKETFDSITRIKDQGRNDRQNLKPMSDEYEFWGINAKVTEIQAAFGLAQLKALPKRLARLNEMYNIVFDIIKDEENVVMYDDRSKWYIDCLVKDPVKISQALKKDGIITRRFPKPLHSQPVCSRKELMTPRLDSTFVFADGLYDNGLYLPSTTNLSDEEMKTIGESLKRAVKDLQ
jgi:perosamine synthetase